MRVHLCVVGRLRHGPEKTLVDDYLSRFEAAGRPLGLTLGAIREVDERKARTPQTTTQEVLRAIPDGATIWALDERGTMMPSPGFAQEIAAVRDAGVRDLALCIGGADGFAQTFRDRSDKLVSLGPMVLPHMLARIILAEQLYRAATILAGSPYHRG